MYDILRRKNAGLKDEVVDFAQQLVRKSSPSLQEREIANLVRQKMEIMGYDRVIQDDSGNVVGIMLGRETEPTLLLNCHMDTVSPTEQDLWETEPLSGQIKDGKLYGCGASDCKGGLAAQIFAGALLKRSLLPLRGNLIVAATVGEEQGTSVGVRQLIEHTLTELELTPTYAILGEPTELGLYYGHDGWVEMDIKVEGANVFDVDDAAKTIFEEFDSRIKAIDSRGGHEELTAQSPLYESCDGLRRATIEVNHRFNDSQEPDVVVDQIKHQATLAVQAIGNIAVDVAVRKETQKMYTGTTTVTRKVTNAWEIDPFCPLMERSRHALEAAGCPVRPGKWNLGRVGMATAGGVITKDYKIPAIGYGPGNEKVIHGPNEYVEVDKIIAAVYGTAAIAHSLIGVPVFGWTSDDI
ncbi:MAG: M20/M25/M40 family metallo-hydrolase [Kiritimatiellae bacterium]|nr:M20/M25/M40 family metallo-hydrolase [Kiritimatiellia bacterium]